MMELPWDLKYAPKSLEEFIFNDDETKQYFVGLKQLDHMLFAGLPGTGKTTLAKLLVNIHGIDEMDVLVINASDDNNVDFIRDRVKSFISTSGLGKYKVVILDEADYLSRNSQAILRGMINDYTNIAKFILTCNYDHMISGALDSRCGGAIMFRASDRYDIVEYVTKILIKENIKVDFDILDQYVEKCYPDIRKTVKLIQKHCVGGELKPLMDSSFNIITYIDNKNWVKLKQELIKQPNIELIYHELIENLHLVPKFSDISKYEDGIITIADYLRNQGSNPVVSLTACMMSLSKI